MDKNQKLNQNQNIPNPSGDAVAEDIKKAKNIIEKIKAADYSSFFRGFFDNFFAKYTKFIIIGGISLGVFILLLVVLIMLAGQGRSGPKPTPIPATPIPTPSDEIKNPSRYATDAGVLKIEEDINALDKDLNSVDLKENFLRPPAIEFDESF